MKTVNNIDLICQSKIFWDQDIYIPKKHAYCVSLIKRTKDRKDDDIMHFTYNYVGGFYV